MTFLNPLLLIGLAAAAIPIILHLLNLRKLRTVEFSSLRFLKELQRTKMRKLKVRQILLLILRTLIIVALVLAFSRPTLRGSFAGTLGTHARTTIVVLLDDSPSMSLRNDRGILLAQARTAAAQLLDVVKEGDELYFVPLSAIRQKEEFPPAYAPDLLRTALGQLQPSRQRVAFHDAFGVAAKILGESRNFNREVYLLTDGQASQFFPAEAEGDTTVLFDERVKIFLMESWAEGIQNSGVASAAVRTRIITQDKPVQIDATIGNFSTSPSRNAVVSVYLDGARVAQQSVDIPPLGSALREFLVVPRRRGMLHGYVQLEDDALETDNRRYFVVDVPRRIAVLLVGASVADTRLPALALTASADTAAAGLFAIQQISEAQLSSVDMSRFGVIVLSGIRDLSSTEAEVLAQFVRTGGGLMIFPGGGSNLRNYNETLFAHLKIPPVSPATGLPGRHPAGEEGGETFLTVERVDFAHPLFSGMFEATGGSRTTPSIESPRVYSAIESRPGRQGHVIAALSNGMPFLTEYPADAGRVVLCAVEAGLTWSDFPVKGLFAPLLHRGMLYLAADASGPGQAHGADYIVGERIGLTARLRSSSGPHAYTLVSPSGLEERTLPRSVSASGLATFELTGTTETGIYELRQMENSGTGDQQGSPVRTIAVNIDPAESDTRRITDADLAAFWATIGVRTEQVHRLPAGERIETAVLESRFGVELWKHALAVALLCALLEMIIGRVPRSQSAAEGAPAS